MNLIALSFLELRAALESQASELVTDFMAARSVKKSRADDWSDLTLQVRVRDGRLHIEWRKRIWLNRASAARAKGLRYVPRYLSSRTLLSNAKAFEREEVIQTRDRLAALLKTHRALIRLEKGLTRLGLTGDPADIKAGFIPHATLRKRSGFGRFVGADVKAVGANPVAAQSQDHDGADG